jgi:beta-lactamase regulating signal transducer with metallopeptidase domain
MLMVEIEGLFLNFLKVQLFMIPLLLFYRFVFIKKADFKQQWILHRSLLAGLFLLPFLLFVPLKTPKYLQINELLNDAASSTISAPGLKGVIAPFTEETLKENRAALSPREVRLSSNSIPPVNFINSNENSIVIQGLNLRTAIVRISESILKINIILLLPSCAGFMYSLFKLFRQKKNELNLIKKAESLSMAGKVQIIFSNAVFSPFSSGIFKKMIFIPYSLKNKVYSAEIIIKHEFIHIRKHHILWTYAEYFLSCIFWYNPFIHMLRKSGDFIREILCDAEIVKKISHLQYGRERRPQ